MKRFAITVLPYLIGIPMACCFAAATSFPFLTPGDFSIGLQMIMMAVMSGFYILTFTPLVVVAELMGRKLETHRILPLSAIPVFGAVFPVPGFVLFPDQWWPEEPIDMSSRHLVVFFSIALCSIGIGVVCAIIRHRRLQTAC